MKYLTSALRNRWWVSLVVVLCAAGSGWGKIPVVQVPAEGSGDPAPIASAQTAIPRDTLIQMDRAELGTLGQNTSADQLYETNQRIEAYFAAPNSAGRKAAVGALQQSGVAPAIIGRLTRIRMNWPPLAGGVYYVNEKHGPFDVRYFLGVPKTYDRTKAWPLVIKLAPLEPFLAQPTPDAAQVVQIYNGWINEELTRHSDALVLMPLLNLSVLYGPNYAGLNSVIQPMLHAAGRVNVDPARVYLMGHSTGGFAAWDLALNYPTYFAAFAPLAGGANHDWQRVRIVNLRNVLPVVWQDADDKVVKPQFARALVNLLKGQKIAVDYLETKKLGHALPPDIEQERYQKMRARVRPLYPVEVTLRSNRPDVMFNRNDWVQIWQEDDPGKETHEMFRLGTGHMNIYERSGFVDAKRNGNTINLRLGNVESMRIYLNDQMVDLNKPLTVTINKTQTIRGAIKQDIGQMMNDQIMLGRGWRYYTAVLDVDLNNPAATKPATRPASRPSGRTPRRGTITVGPGAAEGE